ncbi:MAG: ABC transporter permease subunit [Deltaproteobacteria bacterium]
MVGNCFACALSFVNPGDGKLQNRRNRHLGHTELPVTALILLPIVLPAYAGVFAFIIFLGKYGTVNLLLTGIGLLKTPINFIYGLHGLVFIQSLHMLPFIVLSLSAGFTNIDPSFEEAAEVEGASGFWRFLTVTLPLCTPSYLAGAVIVFLWPFTDWLTPLILGQIDFLPSVAYINIAYHFTDVHRKYMGIVAVVVSSMVCIALFLLARWWVERKKYTGLSKGTTSEGRVIEPSPLVRFGSYSYMCFIAALVLVIPIVLGLAAFSRRWVLEPFPTYWTLENFRVILLETPLLIKNSFVFSGLALIFGIAFGLPAAYLIVRTRVPGRNVLDFVITLMLAFPGIAVLFAHGSCLLLAAGYFSRGGRRSIGGRETENFFDHIFALAGERGTCGRGNVFHHGIPGDLYRHLPLSRRMGDPAHRNLFELAPGHGIRHRRRHGFFDDCGHLHSPADHIKNQWGRP